jgi:hypothetical protein
MAKEYGAGTQDVFLEPMLARKAASLSSGAI